MTPDDRQAYAAAADAAIDHPLVQQAVEEFSDNLVRAVRDLPAMLVSYGLTKCLNACAQVARAQALGVDPEELRMTPQEQRAHLAQMMQMMREAGVPVINLAPEEEEP